MRKSQRILGPHSDIFGAGGLQWNGGGYLHRVSRPDSHGATNESSSPLDVFVTILEQARNGNFDDMNRLFDVQKAALNANDQRLAYLATLLLGDAGTAAIYHQILLELSPDPEDYELVIDDCSVLSMRGLLADIPIMLEEYRKVIYIRDAEIIPTWIADIICPRPDRISEGSTEQDFRIYAELVMDRYAALVNRYGTDQILLLKGERFSPRYLVALIMQQMREPYFDLDLRRRFEAMSGLDCATCFRGGQLDPLVMTALLEKFVMENDDLVDLDANERLFYRHRLPT